ncbi:hypothetical protein GCM10009865_47610 [Aeromicrobium ponti]|uniref:Uncharacterized protein DUF3168 n=1 Tax=Cytobacillus oceanisediminis TaxID=665099 RepID=A0A562JCT1_9BACI|nr:DUF3168 domain-containing protein [Cytobacillus oceanisediminis]TWH80996.1 uncharacterized protein DUF3168 [Cytobacillus oceanisediminis]
MKTIRQAINSQLKSIHPRVHFLKPSDTAQFPYLVYTIEITDLGDGLRMVTLDVDGWDNKDDTTELEDLMTSVKNALNRNLIINDNLFMSIYLDRQLALTDDNPQLNRRTNIFLGRLYER